MENNTAENPSLNKIINLSANRAVLVFLLKTKTRMTSINIVLTIIKMFFIPQFQSKLRIKKRKIVNVDHELDNLIPFSADYIKIYMGLTHLWIKSIYFIYREYGKRSLPFIGQYLDDMKKLYRRGFEVYDSCQSTTTRPGSGRNIPLKIVHLVDPHLHCVPSLHVMIVCFNHLRIGTLIRELTGEADTYKAELDYLENQAILITNSVLFMKQHSINCIPAGLFALSSECSEFTDDYAQNLVEEIRKMNADSIKSMGEISSYIWDLYKNFRELSISDSSKEILIDFLYGYENGSASGDR